MTAPLRTQLRSTYTAYRHAHLTQYGDGTLVFQLPERVSFTQDDDTTEHVCGAGEFLWDIANRYYSTLQIASCALWEFLANFQPDPITDPTVPIRTGRTIFVPSIEYVQRVFFGPSLVETPRL